MRAIVIDDSPAMRSEIKAQLTRLGMKVVGEGENGVEALELVRSLEPDFMTLDVIMPEMDGIECYRHLRQLENPPRCLIVSVLAVEPRVLTAYESEILPSHFLKKPYSERDFKEKVELVLKDSALPIPIIRQPQDEGAATEAPPSPTLPPVPPH